MRSFVNTLKTTELYTFIEVNVMVYELYLKIVIKNRSLNNNHLFVHDPMMRAGFSGARLPLSPGVLLLPSGTP